MKIFLDIYGKEEQCRDKLFKTRWPMNFMCPRCGHAKYYLVSTINLYKCRGCRYQCSLTNDTIFASSKIPLTSWFLGILFITQSKEGISALKFRRSLGISVYAAMKMKHKLQHVMKIADDSLALEGLIELDALIGVVSDPLTSVEAEH
ncbi:transposase [Desulfosediminicola sp.]|uniref:transposase n=1 Tax=Desulfosediminicola sp. TaxID=2886825 RepID=UPI003AF22D50